MLTKSNYQRISQEVLETRRAIDRVNYPEQRIAGLMATKTLALNLCVYFKQDNPAFDIDRFINACGMQADQTEN